MRRWYVGCHREPPSESLPLASWAAAGSGGQGQELGDRLSAPGSKVRSRGKQGIKY